MSANYRLRVIKVDGLRWEGKIPYCYAKVRLGERTERTDKIRGTSSESTLWNETFQFSSSDESATFEIRVHKLKWPCNPCVGYVQIEIAELLAKCASGEAMLDLQSSSRQSVQGVLSLHLERISLNVATAIALQEARAAIEQTESGRLTVTTAGAPESTSEGSAMVRSQSNVYRAVGVLVSKLEVLKKVIDGAAEVNPYFKTAWKLIAIPYEAVKDVYDTDKDAIDLLHAIGRAFDFVQTVQSRHLDNKYLQESIIKLLELTQECCSFVSVHLSHGFGRRMASTVTGIKDKLHRFERLLAACKEDINTQMLAYVHEAAKEQSRKMDEILLYQRLSPTVFEMASRPVCFPGTCAEIQLEIINRVSSDTEQNVLWLHGVPGSGKSTISTTIAQHFRNRSQLGAFLSFERGKNDPFSVIRSIAYQLALLDPSIQALISGIVIKTDIHKWSLAEQFERLILLPLLQTRMKFIVIILDALDECGTASSRAPLMKVFQLQFPSLPHPFRFFITSRREHDIDNIFSTGIVSTMELDIASKKSKQDVHSYLDFKISHILTNKMVEPPEHWNWNDDLVSLSKAAGGLFVWASMAVNLISSSDRPFRTLAKLVLDSSSIKDLDELYAKVLDESGIQWTDDESRTGFVEVFSLIIFSKITLSIETIDGILGIQREETCRSMLLKIRCLLSYDVEGHVTLFHASLLDYLTSQKQQSKPWFIHAESAKQLIVHRCFIVMKNMLHFNICGLETSSVRNDDVEGLVDRIKTRIPSHLVYACIHWVQHLGDVLYSRDVFKMLSDFAHHHLLFWFEVLSLIKVFNRVATHALLKAAMWTKNSGVDIAAFLQDASELAMIFATPIIECTPHIYVTMIPLSKDESVVSAHYSRQMSSMVHVQRIGSKRPLKYMRVLEGQSGFVVTISVSQDGRLIASGSADGVIRIWDYCSGELMKVLKGHDDSILSCTFLPDRRRFVSGSMDCTLRIWDTKTDEVVLRSLQGHGQIGSVAVSPDGTRAASGHVDGVVVIWDIPDGKELKRFFGHTTMVSSVAFSFDSRLLVSGCQDSKVRIWDVERWELASGPVIPSTDCSGNHIKPVSFSPDGRRIMCLDHEKNCIRMLEVGTESVVTELDMLGVRSAAFSPCGNHIGVVCASGEIFVLRAETGDTTCGPLKGHSGSSFVCFSPDGQHIISGSEDNTMRIWDCRITFNTPRVSGANRAVAISDDGSRVASTFGSWIDILDTHSGDIIAGALAKDLRYSHQSDTCMSFSRDNSRFASTCQGSTKVWDADTGELIFNSFGTQWDFSIAVFPDVASIAFGDKYGRVMVWTMAGQPISGPLHVHSNRITSLEFSADGTRLASGSSGGEVTLWSTETWQVLSEHLMTHHELDEASLSRPETPHERIASRISPSPINLDEYHELFSETGQANLGSSTDRHRYNSSPEIWQVNPEFSTGRDGCDSLGSGQTNLEYSIDHDEHNSSLENRQASPGFSTGCGGYNFSPQSGQAILESLTDRDGYNSSPEIWQVNPEFMTALKNCYIPPPPTKYRFRTRSNALQTNPGQSTISFSPDGSQVAFLNLKNGSQRTITLIDAEQDRIIFGPCELHGSDTSLVFLQRGLHIVSRVGIDIMLEKLDAEGMHTVCRLHQTVDSFVCSRDGSRIVSWIHEDYMKAWDVSSLLQVRDPGNHEDGGGDSLSKWRLGDDGWVASGRNGQKRLIWIPHVLRKTLHEPGMTVLETRFSTKLDFTGAALGDQWMDCFDEKP